MRKEFCFACRPKGYQRVTSLEQVKTDQGRKALLLRTREHRCEICSNTTWNDAPLPLELDHIDGDHTNNASENLRIICPNCHAQTPTYKAKNTGRGRPRRRTPGSSNGKTPPL